MNKPRLNRKSKWRRQRQSRISMTDAMIRLWAKRLDEAKEKGNYPPVLLKMMASRATYWMLRKSDALLNTQTPMKRSKKI